MSRAKFRRTVSCLLIGLATGISDVIAGNSAVPTWERPYCVDTIVQLKGVSVKEHKWDIGQTSASYVYSMDSTWMKVTQSKNPTEALSRLPGVTVKDYGGVGGMMTLNVRGMESSHVVVTVDGIPQMETQVGQKDFTKYNLPAAEKVMLGFSATESDNWQARNATSSAYVNISTLDGLRNCLQEQRSTSTSLSAEQGSYDTWGIRVKSEICVSPVWATRLATRYQFAANDYPFTLVNGNSKTRQYRENNRTNLFQLEWSHLFRFGRNDEMVGKVCLHNCYRRLPGQVVLYNTSPNNERQLDQEYTFALGWRKNCGGKWETSVHARWGLNFNRYKDINPIYPQGNRKENYRQSDSYMSGKVSYRPSKEWTLSWASDGSYNTLHGNEYTVDQASRITLTHALGSSYHNRVATISGYCVMTSCYNSSRNGQSGEDFHQWSPILMGSIRPFTYKNLILKMYYKNTFRPPSFTETYYYHLGSTNLLPERTFQWGGGIVWQKKIASWWPLMNVICDAFLNSVHDKIISIPVNLHVWKTANLGQVHTKGFSLSLHNQFRFQGHTLMMTGCWSLLKAEDVSQKEGNTYGFQLPYIPVSNGNVTLYYENNYFHVGTTYKGTSSRWGTLDHASSTRLPAYSEWDASIGCPFTLARKTGGTCNLHVSNLFNTQYSLVNGYPMPGRTYLLTITFKL